MSDIIGRTVQFWDWNDKGEEVEFTGTVESVFCDPEDIRDSFRVRLGDGTCRTPYADECRFPVVTVVKSAY